MSKAKAPKKKTNGYKMPDPLAMGEILQDLTKKQWKLGVSIGTGGFGEIYSAQEASEKSSKYNYVIKIEPHSNGPLFVEINFYLRNAKPADVESFRVEKKLKTFGMPVYHGSGSHEYKGEKYRFLVMDKFGKDIWKIFLDNGKKFSVPTVFKLGVQMIEVLEYIHDKGYVHADIKGANILLGTSKETEKQAYLVDFGLSCKYNMDKEFKPNPKKAHDGTIEYLSRDAHKGVQTRRGDLEILAYNLIHWLGCTLPWEKDLSKAEKVHELKTTSMNDIPKFLKTCFKSDNKPPTAITELLKYINNLKFNAEPDYDKIKKLFIAEIKNAGGKLDGAFDFNSSKSSVTKRKSRSNSVSPVKKSKIVSTKEKASTKLKAKEAEDVVETKAKSKDKKIKKVVASEESDEEEEAVDPYKGFTPEMRVLMEKKLQNQKAKTKKPKLSKVSEVKVADTNGFNDEMLEVQNKLKSKENGSNAVRGRPIRNVPLVEYKESSPSVRKTSRK